MNKMGPTSHRWKLSFLAGILIAAGASGAAAAREHPPTLQTRKVIISELHRAAYAQLYAWGEHMDTSWLGGVFWGGYAAVQRLTHSPLYADVMLQRAQQAHFALARRFGGIKNANNMCIGRLYEAVFALRHKPAMLADLQKAAAELAKMKAHRGDITTQWNKSTPWYWCDALFMAAPVLARLSAETHDPHDLHILNVNFARTEKMLYDPKERLFYRDPRFIHARDPDGHHIFWSRGNGWVVAALAEILHNMPAHAPHRRRYVTLLQRMAGRLAQLQPADGLWRPSLTDPAWYPLPESSGTALDCYAMAWGVRHGILNKKQFMPVILRAWAGLLKCQQADGLIGRTQRTGAAPAWVEARCSRPYGVGAFLMAGAQMARLAPFRLPHLPPMPRPPVPHPTQHDVNHHIPQPTGEAFVRYVPERYDDIAWEDNRIAYRIFGPQLGLVEPAGSGIDVWAKSVRYPIINIRYKLGIYHVNLGNGLDCYDTGFSRGCGGLGIWSHGRLRSSTYWQYYRIIKRGPNTAEFQVWYKPWNVGGGRKVWEKRTITLRNGSNLNRIQTVLQSNKPGPLIVGVGVANHGNGTLVVDKKIGMLGYWEPRHGKNGSTGIGVRFNPVQLVGVTHDRLNIRILLLKVNPGQKLTYYTGACWSEGLDFHTAAQWLHYLRHFKAY